MTTLHLRKSIGRSPLRLGFLLITLALACFALLSTGQAQLPPPAPDGGYPGGNTAEGDGALSNVEINIPNGTGVDNTAIGFDALNSNTTGDFNTANGFQALQSNTTGGGNTANGDEALFSNTTGNDNTATGVTALFSNTTGSFNTANGYETLFHNTTGGGNIATGPLALFHNTTGSNNMAYGGDALFINTTGSDNIAIGDHALFISAGSNNIAVGFQAGVNITAGSNNIDIGNQGVMGESGHIRIGTAGTQRSTFIAGISGATVSSGVPVIVDSSGHLGTTTSSVRFKEAIKPMDKASEAILALKPVTFRYKHELDPDCIPQFGLVAEDVGKVNPDLVVRDKNGEIYTVRYEAVNAMLLNEFLKEHRTVQELKTTVAQQQKQIEELTAGLQKVSAQLETSKPAPQTVLNNQ
jgi:hypothetical protein